MRGARRAGWGSGRAPVEGRAPFGPPAEGEAGLPARVAPDRPGRLLEQRGRGDPPADEARRWPPRRARALSPAAEPRTTAPSPSRSSRSLRASAISRRASASLARRGGPTTRRPSPTTSGVRRQPVHLARPARPGGAAELALELLDPGHRLPDPFRGERRVGRAADRLGDLLQQPALHVHVAERVGAGQAPPRAGSPSRCSPRTAGGAARPRRCGRTWVPPHSSIE